MTFGSIWKPLLLLIVWYFLMMEIPIAVEASESNKPSAVVGPRQLDLEKLRDAAAIGGVSSILTATIWSVGLVASARYKFLGRRNGQCGEP